MGGLRLLQAAREDQPAVTRIHGFETEDIAEKCAVRLSVLTVDNYVSARDHLLLRRNVRNSYQAACSVESRKPNRDQLRTLPTGWNHSGPSTALNLPSSLQSSLIRPARFSYSSACSFVMPRYVAACNASDCWWDNSESSSANCLASCADVVSSSVPIGTLTGRHNNGLSVFVRYSTYLRNPKYPSVRPRTNRCEIN